MEQIPSLLLLFPLLLLCPTATQQASPVEADPVDAACTSHEKSHHESLLVQLRTSEVVKQVPCGSPMNPCPKEPDDEGDVGPERTPETEAPEDDEFNLEDFEVVEKKNCDDDPGCTNLEHLEPAVGFVASSRTPEIETLEDKVNLDLFFHCWPAASLGDEQDKRGRTYKPWCICGPSYYNYPKCFCDPTKISPGENGSPQPECIGKCQMAWPPPEPVNPEEYYHLGFGFKKYRSINNGCITGDYTYHGMRTWQGCLDECLNNYREGCQYFSRNHNHDWQSDTVLAKCWSTLTRPAPGASCGEEVWQRTAW